MDSSVPATTPVSHHLSIWRSPVAYLLGGMAAVSMLITAALLLLILSYWQFRNRIFRTEQEQRGVDAEAGEERSINRRGESSRKATYRERFAVIMAGEDRPRFLASPKCYGGRFGLEDGEEKQSALGKTKRSYETTSYGVP